jgi:hypothetical protein
MWREPDSPNVCEDRKTLYDDAELSLCQPSGFDIRFQH